MKLPKNYACKQMTDVKLWLFDNNIWNYLTVQKMSSGLFKNAINKMFTNDIYLIINWITMTRKSGRNYVWHTETLDCCFDLIMSCQLRTLWPATLEIKLATIECRTKTLSLSDWSKSISHSKYAANYMYIRIPIGDTVTLRATSSQKDWRYASVKS